MFNYNLIITIVTTIVCLTGKKIFLFYILCSGGPDTRINTFKSELITLLKNIHFLN